MTERFQVGDFVSRISHNKDVLFKIEGFQTQAGRKIALLKGVDLRLCADAPIEDLNALSAQEINRYRQVYLKRSVDLMRGIEHRHKDIYPEPKLITKRTSAISWKCLNCPALCCIWTEIKNIWICACLPISS